MCERTSSERTSRNIEALSWKHIRKKCRLSDDNLFPFLVVANQSYSLNSCHQIHLWIIPLLALIKLFFSRELSNAIWKNDIRKIPNFKFFQLYHYFVVFTEKYNGDLFITKNFLWKTEINPVFYEGHIKTIELCTT